MKKLFTLLTIVAFPYFLMAQKESNNWFFGVLAGLDFSNGSPEAVTNSPINQGGGGSSISTPGGRLLFFTDGETVYDSMHAVMPNGTGLDGDVNSTQAALIVPQPGADSIYYIFTTDAVGGAGGFSYSIVNMSQNGGLGDVVTKNAQLINSAAEKISAVKSFDGLSYWIMAHEWGTNAFYAYELSSTGLNSTPVISNVGVTHSTARTLNAIGQMKFSHDGNMLAAAVYKQSITQLFYFDNIAGIVETPVTIYHGPSGAPYGVEFSPDNTKLYTSSYDSVADMYSIVQFDLSSGDSLTIVESADTLSITDSSPYRALQIGPDGKIYIAKAFQSTMALIEFPNMPATSAGFNDFGVDLDPQFNGSTNGMGLPGFPQDQFPFSPPLSTRPVVVDNTLLYPNPAKDYFILNGLSPAAGDMMDIYSMLGNKVLSVALHGEASTAINVSRLSQGVYYVYVRGSKETVPARLVKE